MREQRRPRSPDAVIATFAARQHGVVAFFQLRRAGVSVKAVEYRLGDGRLHRLHHGVYAVGHRNVPLEGRWLAAVLACGPRAVLSHRSAAALWLLRPGWRQWREVTVPRTAGGPRGIVVHRPRSLDPSERTLHHGVPVTTVERTLADVADVVGLADLRKLLEQAEFHRYDASPVPVPGRRGARRLELALEGMRVRTPRMTRSELEDRMLAVCAGAGLPLPRSNMTIGRMEVDFAWPEQRVAVEADGWAAHGTRIAFGRDRRRSTRLQLLGWTVVRFTYDDISFDVPYVRDALARLLARGSGAWATSNP